MNMMVNAFNESPTLMGVHFHQLLKTTATDGHKTLPSQRPVVSNKKMDGLEINAPVKVTVGAIDEMSSINSK